ncbi:MAG: transporter substrate-binding domain-containing protein [Bacteroidia bacterium]|nr:transporter substrate-binding domain-containing protein [Bacteroidia bacterium]
MKNKSKFLVIAILVIILAACSGRNTGKINEVSDLKGKVIGMVSSGTSTQSTDLMLSKLIGGEPKEVLYFNRGSDVIAAIMSGKIDACPTHMFSANYFLQRNDKLKALDVKAEIEGGVIMAVRSEDLLLKEDLNKAIATLQGNGTIKQLEDKWIKDLPANEEPSNKEMPKINGAKTVYVGVCGDFAPLDYMAADGRPAGYNVAILTEIGKLLSINFEFVSIETQARFAALSSKKIDVIFCHFESNNTAFFDELKNNNWISTMPYYIYKGGCFIVKK